MWQMLLEIVCDQVVLAPSMSSPPDSPASLSAALLGSMPKVQPMSDGYGVTLPDWLLSFDHSTSSWKTRQSCLPLMAAEPSQKSQVTWPKSGTMRNGMCYQRPPLVRGIGGIAYGLLPTPVASDWGSRKPSSRPHLTANGTFRHLNAQGKQSFMRLSQVMKLYARRDDGLLNPDFVEWLMGYPVSYTNIELKCLATASSLSSPSTSGNVSSEAA
jgi:hypothetical protein